MGIELDAIDSGNVLEFLDWSRQTCLWDGREVEVLDDALLFRNDAEKNLLEQLFSKQSPADFDRMAHALAEIGAGREIEKIDLSECEAVPVGLRKSCSKFWKKHKTAILVGIAIVAIVVTVVVVTTVTGGAGAAGGAAAMSAVCNEEDEKRKKGESSPPPEPLKPATPPEPEKPLECPNGTNPFLPNTISFAQNEAIKECFEHPRAGLPEPEKPLECPSSSNPFLPNTISFAQNGVIKDGKHVSYREMLDQGQFERVLVAPQEHTPPSVAAPSEKRSMIGRMLEMMGDHYIDPDLKDPSVMPIPPERSRTFVTEGPRMTSRQIGGINGIWNQYEDAQSHAAYLNKMAQGQSIEWVYNKSNGYLIDPVEAFLLNPLGFAPNTANLLLQNWQQFHEANRNNPNAKYLQFVHSQGSLQAKEALYRAPPEIRDRIIVVAIAPATVIPEELCHKSFNYVSMTDPVHLTDLIANGFICGPDSEYVEILEKHREQIIWLTPHPDAKMIDHDFQSPTFLPKIKEHIREYLNLEIKND